MDQSKIEQIKQENAATKAKGIIIFKVIFIALGIFLLGFGLLFWLGTKGTNFASASPFFVVGLISLVLGFILHKKKDEAVVNTATTTAYGSDITELNNTLTKIEEIVSHEKLKNEFGYVTEAVKADIKQASEIANKLTNVNKMVANEANDQKRLEVEDKLKAENAKETKDEFVLKTLNEQLTFIDQMRKNKTSLEAQLQKIKQNVSMIYTKLVMVDTSDNSVKDEACLDIQKILDRKISAQKFEQDL